jgi:hypothetical protein
MGKIDRGPDHRLLGRCLGLTLLASGCVEAEGAGSAKDASPASDISLTIPPDGWVQTPHRCGVRFWGPPEMVEVAVQGVDSCVFQFRTANCQFGGDSGGYSDPLTQDEGELDFDARAVRIDGREGKLVRYRSREGSSQPYVAALNVPLPSPPRWRLATTFYASCSSIAARDEALLSIRTATIAAEGETKSDGGVGDTSVASSGSRIVPIVLEESSSVTVTAGEVFTIVVKFIGENGTMLPDVASPIVRFVGIDPTPASLQTPGGAVRLFRFEAREIGPVELTFAGAAGGDAGTPTRTITVHVRQP